ncbi:hypothetical protein PHYSODRAFT_337962 [Phytophthora sojae]|uniref:Uncharacterized protein n=1 Tax=Phytophthora sojae (strain P6497) TaxID=1094619 RepID=G4ZZT5_PHYSP|nr:hypothetical protein PHYSODRAFT_337962 [Phytophthora sojae]EGZ11232.1 hypothetical protein PHYSODRAFT_337962 [Phytophthora sojae]|eukprot:XP_009533977.1 hypothetical protein PHYSODRAFT_337962 [Phytophthora sojae]
MARRASKSSPARPRALAASADTAGAPASSSAVNRPCGAPYTRASKRLQKRKASDAPVPPASRTAPSEGSSVEVGPTGDPAELVVASQSSPGANAKGQEPAPRRQAPGKRKARKTADHQTAALSIRRSRWRRIHHQRPKVIRRTILQPTLSNRLRRLASLTATPQKMEISTGIQLDGARQLRRSLPLSMMLAADISVCARTLVLRPSPPPGLNFPTDPYPIATGPDDSPTYQLNRPLQQAMSEFVRKTGISLPRFVELLRGQTSDDYRPNKTIIPGQLTANCSEFKDIPQLLNIANNGIQVRLTKPLPRQAHPPQNHPSA